MTKDEIKQNAPKGATGYVTPVGRLVYIKDTIEGRRIWKNDRWMIFNFHSPSIKPL